VKRLRKILLVVLGLVVVLIVAALVGLNLYVQSPGAIARIQAQLSDALGIPLQITSVSVGWNGVRVSGVRIPGESGGNFLEANSFSADYQLWPLLSKHLVIDRMVLDSPKVIWAQNAEGKWVLPMLPEKARKENPVLNPPGEKIKTPETPPFEVSLDKLEITNGSIQLLDANQAPIAIASEVEMRYTLRTTGRVEGTISAKKLVWQNALTFQELHSPMVFTKTELSLPELQAKAAGGTVEAAVNIQTEAKDSPFTMQLKLSDLDLAQVAAEGGWEANQAAGTIGGKLALHGTLKRLDRTEGDGEITLADGQFKQLELFQTIGVVLQIPELADLRVRTGQAKFRIKDEKTYLDQLVLDSQNLQFSTTGTIRFDGKLGLDAKLSLSASLLQQLPTFVRGNFNPPDDKGRQSIDFDITGKTDKPKTNLVDRVIGRRMNTQLDSLVDNIFGNHKTDKGEKKKKKKDEPASMPAEPQQSGPAAVPPNGTQPGATGVKPSASAPAPGGNP
jgi:uncharacterized protein involved in outer membrane biogenesis